MRQPLDAPMDNINDWRHSLSQPAQGESEEMGNISALLAFPLEEIAAQMTFMDFQFYQSIQVLAPLWCTVIYEACRTS